MRVSRSPPAFNVDPHYSVFACQGSRGRVLEYPVDKTYGRAPTHSCGINKHREEKNFHTSVNEHSDITDLGYGAYDGGT